MLEISVNNKEYKQGGFVKKASRALIIMNQKMAVLYSKKYDFYMTPGGGVEENETFEDACIREAIEEAGMRVKPLEKVAILKSSYPHITIEHHYFVCEFIQNESTNQTIDEQDQDLELRWLSFDELKNVFSKRNAVEKYDLWLRREYTVISELKEYIEKE